MKFPDNSFAVFFDEMIALEGKRPNGATVRGTFAACVMPAEKLDPFAEDAAQSKIYKRGVLIAKTGDNAWNDREPPQIGDKLTINGTAWAVASVDPFCDDHYTLEVRSC